MNKEDYHMRIKLNIVLASIFLILHCGAKSLKEDGNIFMEALKNSDAEKSFQMLDSSIQTEVGGMEGWKVWIQSRKPVKWEFTKVDTKTESSVKLTGNADFSVGQHLNVELNFEKFGDNWKIIGIDFRSY